jgi:hypothetical protein
MTPLGWVRISGGATLTLANFREADMIWGAAIVLSLVLTFFLRETGSARRSQVLTGRR